MYYIDTNGNYYEGDQASLHDIAVTQRPSPDHTWINGAWVLSATSQIATLQGQIKQIENGTNCNRAVREYLLLKAEQDGAAAGLTPTQLYAANIGYARMKDTDNQIVALRAQITALGG